MATKPKRNHAAANVFSDDALTPSEVELLRLCELMIRRVKLCRKLFPHDRSSPYWDVFIEHAGRIKAFEDLGLPPKDLLEPFELQQMYEIVARLQAEHMASRPDYSDVLEEIDSATRSGRLTPEEVMFRLRGEPSKPVRFAGPLGVERSGLQLVKTSRKGKP